MIYISFFPQRLVYTSVSLMLAAGLSACGGGGGGGSVSPALDDSPSPIQAVADLAFSDDGVATIAVLSNDTEDNNQILTLADFDTSSANAAVITRDDNGTPTDESDDSLVYTAANPVLGADTFRYTAQNEDGDTRRGQVTVVNILAVKDNLRVVSNPSLSPTDPSTVDVLANDLVGDAYVALLDSFDASSANGGTITLDDGGTPTDTSDDKLQYLPAPDYSGDDEFNYRLAIAEGGFATGTVIIEVGPVCSEQQAEKQAAGEKYCVELTIASFDDTTIALQLFVPATTSDNKQGDTSLLESQGHAPLLVHSHGYGGNKAEDFFPEGTQIDRQISLDAWEAGYWVISYTQRGFGGTDPSAEVASSGRIGLMSPEKEGLDFVSLINWATCYLREGFDPLLEDTGTPMDPEAGCNASGLVTGSLLSSDNGDEVAGLADDPAVGTIGYSYGGGFQYNAQSVDTRVDAILPMGTWHDLRYSLAPHDTPKITWISLLTTFSLQGGNGEQQPDVIVNALTEAMGTNTTDGAFSKPRQISTTNYNILAPNGAVAYCDNHKAEYLANADSPNANGDPAVYPTEPPTNAVLDRQARADMFLIQGYGDTLFHFNEAWDNTRCFKEAGVDVHTIFQTSGHPLPGIGPAHYAGVNQSMYLDEVVHCGIDSEGKPIRYNTRELGLTWFDDKLRSEGDFSDVFPYEFCITVENTDPTVVLDTEDPFFNNGTTNTSTASVPTTVNPGTNRNFKFSREGVVGDVDELIVGGLEVAVPSTVLTTGVGGQSLFVEVYEQTSGSQTMAGIPTAQLNIARPASNKGTDEIFFVGVGVQRCHENPADTGPCEGNDWELLHFQVSPIRLFPSLANETAPTIPPTDDVESFPKTDPRNDKEAPKHVYAIRWGENLGGEFADGRLPGVSARLNEGDKVGLALFAEIGVYQSISTSGAGTTQVTVDGTIKLPMQSLSDRPGSDESYFVPQP